MAIKIKMNKRERYHVSDTWIGSMGNAKDCIQIRYIQLSGYNNYSDKLRIMLAIDEDSRWKWITFKKEFESIEEAKIWLKTNESQLSEKYQIHKF